MNDLFDFDDFFRIEKLSVLIKATGVDLYDFDFRNYFNCNSIINTVPYPVLLRIGAVTDYDFINDTLQNIGMKLLISKEEQEKVSKLENWYSLISEYTPYTKLYDQLPTAEDLEKDFSFPVFIKGNRQTNHHLRSKSIIKNREMYEKLRQDWKEDDYLYWQKAAVREYVPLLTVDDTSFPDMIPFSLEFRVFVWRKNIVGLGRYWCLAKDYTIDKKEERYIQELVHKAALRIDSIFFSVDVAKSLSGDWIIIEVNDGQESGYGGTNRYKLWRNIVDLECRY